MKTSLNNIDIKRLLDDFLNFNLKGFELNSSAVLAFTSSIILTAFSSLSASLSGINITFKVLLVGLVPLLNSIYSYVIFKNGLTYTLLNIFVANLLVSGILSIMFLIVFFPIDIMTYILLSLKNQKE